MVYCFIMIFRLLSWLPLLFCNFLLSSSPSVSTFILAFIFVSFFSSFLIAVFMVSISSIIFSELSPWPICNCQLRSQWDYSNWSLRMLHVASMLRRRTNVTSFVSKSTRPDTDSPPHQNWCREHLQKLATSTARFCIENNLEYPILHIIFVHLLPATTSLSVAQAQTSADHHCYAPRRPSVKVQWTRIIGSCHRWLISEFQLRLLLERNTNLTPADFRMHCEFDHGATRDAMLTSAVGLDGADSCSWTWLRAQHFHTIC